MSIARAFTPRRNRQIEADAPMPAFVGRAASQRAGKPVSRSMISLPVELLSTTNSLAHLAPDIKGTMPIPRQAPHGSAASTSSGDDSDLSTPNGSIHSADNSTDASSVDESPSPCEPAPNHLSCYFKPAVDSSSSATNSVIVSASNPPSRTPSLTRRASFDANVPQVPDRAASHSKKAHERLNRKRSLQRMMSPSRGSSRDLRLSADMFSVSSASNSLIEPVGTPAPAARENPFGKELAQLDEVVEEFGHAVRDAEADADTAYLASRGLACFAATDYASEIFGLLPQYFDTNAKHSDAAAPATVTEFGGWI